MTGVQTCALPISEAAVGATSWIHDPADSVPAQGGQMLMGTPENSGPHDQRGVEARDGVAVFTGPPLTEPVTQPNLSIIPPYMLLI